MEPIHPPLLSRLLTKRQRSSLSPSFESSDSAILSHFSNFQKNPFFFQTNCENQCSSQKKVKFEAIYDEKFIQESPETRIDEDSPNFTACLSPPLIFNENFNENLLGSPARYDLDRFDL